MFLILHITFLFHTNIHAEQKNSEEDVPEIRQGINKFRFKLVEILRKIRFESAQLEIEIVTVGAAVQNK